MGRGYEWGECEYRVGDRVRVRVRVGVRVEVRVRVRVRVEVRVSAEHLVSALLLLLERRLHRLRLDELLVRVRVRVRG